MTRIAWPAQPSLVTTICVNFGKVALATIITLSVVVLGTNYYLDDEHLYLEHVRYETQSLLNGVKNGAGGLSFDLPDQASHYDGRRQAAYGFRVLDGTGRVIAARQSALLDATSPWLANSPVTTDFWFAKLQGDKPFHFAGGKRLRIDDTDVLIEVMTLGDPAGRHWWTVLRETAEDVWLPILPLMFALPLVTIVSVRRALQPLARSAQQAEAIDPANPDQHLDLAGIPRETAAFASAINRLMERVSALVKSQKVFIASAAHELRTPLSVMLLELERIDHSRARRLERDVKGMAESVNRLLVLARLEHSPELTDLDLGAIAGETIDRLRTWADAQDHTIDLRLRNPQTLRGDPSAVREALRNLIENAIKHTPAGTSVCITVGPERTITVEDSGPGLASETSDQLFQPFRKGRSSSAAPVLALPLCGGRSSCIAARSRSAAHR
jgi:signal transduction histidine kinase